MANRFYKLALGGIFAIIVIGGYMAFTGYANDVYPLDQSVGFLDRIVATSDPQSIIADINSIKSNLPETGNPVWIFPTDSTNFARIQADLDTMLISAEKIAAVPTDSAAYHTGMLDINSRSALIQENIAEIINKVVVITSDTRK